MDYIMDTEPVEVEALRLLMLATDDEYFKMSGPAANLLISQGFVETYIPNGEYRISSKGFELARACLALLRGF